MASTMNKAIRESNMILSQLRDEWPVRDLKSIKMKKGSVFANKKGPLAAGFGTPVNMSASSTSFFDNSLQHMPPNPLGPARNWQATPMSSHRLPPYHYQQQPSSASSIRAHPSAVPQTPNSNLINRVKPHTLHGLVENLNEVIDIWYSSSSGINGLLFVLHQLLADLGVPHCLRFETKYGFEDILTILDVGVVLRGRTNPIDQVFSHFSI